MKFTCLQENLVKGLSIVNKAVTNKGNLPILSNVLISTDNGRIKLSSTNLETSITVWLGASVENEGTITIPAKVLYDFVSNINPSTLSATLEGSTLKIVSDKVVSKFNGMDSTEFPTLNNEFKEAYVSVPAKSFNQAVLETAFSAAIDESRPALTGVFMKSEGGNFFVVAVDGFRLAERKIENVESFKEFSVIVPSKIALEVARIIGSSKDNLEISLNDDGNLIIFKCGDLLLSSHVIEGAFPNYKALIPKETEFLKATIDSKELGNALKLTNIFATDSLSVAKLHFAPEENAITISSSNNEIGENDSRIDSSMEGNELKITFNSKYILDVLTNVKSDTFNFEFSEKVGPGVPAVMTIPERTDFIYLLMPLNIQ